MNHDDVRDIFARTLSAPPVPRQGTDEIVTAGRRLERRRQTLTLGGMVTAIAAGVVGIGLVLQQGGPGSGAPGFDGASPSAAPVAGWNPSGEPDPERNYYDSLSQAVGEGLPKADVDTETDTPFLFEWEDGMKSIASHDYLKIEGGDSLVFDVTIHEPKPDADVDTRLKDLAGCAEDCTLTDLGDLRLLTKEDQVTPDDFGPRTRYQALIARPDGTVAAAALRVEDDSPGTIGLTMDELTGVAKAMPDTTTAPVGGPAPEDTDTNSEAPPAYYDDPADPDGALLEAVEATFAENVPGAALGTSPGTAWDYKFTWGSALGSKELRALLTLPDGSKYEITVEIERFRTDIADDDRAQLESRGKCGAGDNECTYTEQSDGEMLLTKAQHMRDQDGILVATLHRAWLTRDDDSYVGIFVEQFEDQSDVVPPVTLETIAKMLADIPLTELPVK